MSDLESSPTGLSEESAPAQREGLPRGYRMRADAHYVDQLESRHAGPAIRLIDLTQIDGGELPSPAGLEALTESIATHGVLQPLLVRRSDSRYRLIAGRKRLTAALAAGLTTVPCVVHHVDEEKARLLAEAANVSRSVDRDPVEPLAYGAAVAEVLRALAADLASIGSLAAMTRPGVQPPLHNRVNADLIQAQAWRAAWFASATSAVRAAASGRMRTLESILERVKAAFEPEARLSRLRLEVSIASNATSMMIDEEFGTALVTGCVLATLSWLEAIEDPRIDIRILAPNPRTIRIEVVQRQVPAGDSASAFSTPGMTRSSQATSSLAWHIVRTLAQHHGGSAEFTAIAQRGTILEVTLMNETGPA